MTMTPFTLGADIGLTKRIRLLAYCMFVTSVFALAGSLIFYPTNDQQRFWSFVLSSLSMLTTVALYVFATTRYARIGVYASLLATIALLAAIDPLSGNLGGGSWVLFQICAPVAALVLRQPRGTLSIAVISVLALLGVGILQLSGTIPVRLTAATNSLYFNLTMQIVILIVLAAIITLITTQEQRALEQVQQAQQESTTQLQRVNQLLADQQRLNSELAHSVAETRARDDQLVREQERQQELRRTVASLSAPIIPILPGVVVVPLVGSFDTPRLADFSNALLSGIENQRARIAVLDVTGVDIMDTAIAQTLVAAATSSRLLGAHVIVVGISPESAQMLVSLGADLAALHPMASLQQAMTYAMGALAA